MTEQGREKGSVHGCGDLQEQVVTLRTTVVIIYMASLKAGRSLNFQISNTDDAKSL